MVDCWWRHCGADVAPGLRLVRVSPLVHDCPRHQTQVAGGDVVSSVWRQCGRRRIHPAAALGDRRGLRQPRHLLHQAGGASQPGEPHLRHRRRGGVGRPHCSRGLL